MNFIVSETDFHYFEMKYGKLSNHFIPSFHEHNEVVIPDGLGKFVLYHGNLSVSENYEAAMHLIKNIFSVIWSPRKSQFNVTAKDEMIETDSVSSLHWPLTLLLIICFFGVVAFFVDILFVVLSKATISLLYSYL